MSTRRRLQVKPLILALFASLFWTCSDFARADESGPTTQADFQVIVDYFSHSVSEVSRPFWLYHWRNDPSLVQSEEAQRDPSKFGRQIVVREGPSFVRGLYVKGRTNGMMYGGGLYTALDAVATEVYGSKDPNLWVVLAMHIPRGFHLLTLSEQPVPEGFDSANLNSILKKFECPVPDGPQSPMAISGLFGARELTKTCANLISDVIHALKIDGFSYSYSVTPFKACTSSLGDDRWKAIVLTSNSWLKLPGANALAYTSRTKVDLEERRAIESQFIYTNSQGTFNSGSNPFDYNQVTKVIAEKLPNLKGSLNGLSQTCTSNECTYLARFNNSTEVLRISQDEINRFYYPSFPKTFSIGNGFGVESLHWNDLLNTTTTLDMDNWVKSNLLDCGSVSTTALVPLSSQ